MRHRQLQDTRAAERYVRCWIRAMAMRNPITCFRDDYNSTGDRRQSSQEL
jgi:hypothetical protein